MNKKIKTGILGAGQPNIATNQQIPATRNSEHFELKALCDISPDVFEYAQKYNTQAFQSYEDMLAVSSLDMIQIATPDWLHCEQTEMAFAAGKHVLLQKPACLSLKELDRIITAWEKSGKMLQILLNGRETRLNRTIKGALEAYLIGEVREIRIAYRGHRFPISNPASPYLKAKSGGVWLHNGLHWLDEAAFYAESVPLMVQVFANKNSEGTPEYLGDGPNYWSSYFIMKNTVTFHFEYNTMLLQDGMPSGIRRVIIGTHGEIRQDFGEDDLIIYQPNKTPQKLPLLDNNLTPGDDVIESFTRALNGFAKRIVNPERTDDTTLNSLLLMRALLTGVESYKTGKNLFIGSSS
jgi:predicted dehydrogenase